MLEVLSAVAIIGIVASCAYILVSGINTRAKEEKLSSDVATLNRAVIAYEASGGSLDSLKSGAKVIEKLKSTVNLASRKTAPGISSSFVDYRLICVMQSDKETSSRDLRAEWSSAEGKFVLSRKSQVPGIKRFDFDEEATLENQMEDSRNFAFTYAKEGTWVWDYADTSPPSAPTGPTTVTTTTVAPPTITPSTTTIPVSTAPPAPNPLTDLDPPTFSIPPGDFAFADFDLVVSITNPNSPTVSDLLYSINYGPWEYYPGGDVTVAPGTVLRASVIPKSPDYRASSVNEGTYGVITEQLVAPTISPSDTSFASSENITVDLTNPNDPAVSQLDYRLDGGAWQTYSAPFVLASSSFTGGVTIEAKATATSPYWQDSPLASSSIARPPTQLNTPSVNLSDTQFNSTVNLITITLNDPNTAGSALYYSLKQPADSYPDPSAFLPYSGPFQVSSSTFPDGFHIQAYARSTDPTLYLDSSSTEAMTTADFFGVPLSGDILLVLDASGSMNASWSRTTRFRRVIEEAGTAINSLSPGQKFGVAVFNQGLFWTYGSGDLQEATSENIQEAISGLNALNSRGGTSYEAGLAYAQSLATPPSQIIFLSDGRPNYNNYNDEVDALVAQGTVVNTLGLGSASQTQLQELASRGGGSYRYVSEPGTAGTLMAPSFSLNGGEIRSDELPAQLELTDPNSDPGSRVFVSIDGAAYQVYSGPIDISNKMTVDAFCESTDEAWAPSSLVTEVYTIKAFKAEKPEIVVSSDRFEDTNPTITVTLVNHDTTGLTLLVWWFENQTEQYATPYGGPFPLPAADWNSYAGDSVEDIKIFARAVSDRDFVESSDIDHQSIQNQTTAFKDNLNNKQPLLDPVINPNGGKLNYSQLPLTIEMTNPDAKGGIIMYSIDGSPFVAYSGPFTIDGPAQIGSFTDATGVNGRRSSEPAYKQFSVETVALDKPVLSYSSKEFQSKTDTITVTANNPNPGAISQLIYWWSGVQDEDTEATVYTGPITLSAADWEQYAKQGKNEAKLKFRAVGTESFVEESGHTELKIQGDYGD